MHPSAPPTLEIVERAAVGRCVVVSGDWRMETLARGLPELEARLAHLGEHQGLWWDLEQVAALDSGAAALLWKHWRGARPAGLSLRPEQDALLERLARV